MEFAKKFYVCEQCQNDENFQICFDKLGEVRLVFGTCAECRRLFKQDFVAFSDSLSFKNWNFTLLVKCQLCTSYFEYSINLDGESDIFLNCQKCLSIFD